MLNVIRTPRKTLSGISFFQLSRSSRHPPRWDLPLPLDVMVYIIDEHLAIPTIVALSMTYRALRPYCYAKIFRDLKICEWSEKGYPKVRDFAKIIQASPDVLEQLRPVTVQGMFTGRHSSTVCYILSQIAKRSCNLVSLHLANNTAWHKVNKTLRKHIITLLSQGSLRNVDLHSYDIPLNVLGLLPDLKQLWLNRSPGHPCCDIVPDKRRVKVEELRLSGVQMGDLLNSQSPFDFSGLKVFEVHRPWVPYIQEILELSSASLCKLDLVIGYFGHVDLGVLTRLNTLR